MTFQKNLADFYFVKTGNIKKALEMYLDVLTAHPEDLESLMNIGLVCLSLNRVVDAEVFFKRVLELEPWNAQASEQLYKIHSSKTHECTKNNEEDLYKKACRHIDSGNTEEAINQLKELLNIYPDSAIAHNDLGVLYYRKGDKTRSQYHYEQALELMPENTTFKKNLADFYYIELGKIKEALRIYVDILNDNPKDVETLMITGHICLSLEQFDDAKVFYDRVLNIDPFHSDAKKNIKQLENVCVANDGYDKKKNLI
jgi:tetratricopeptide (TPR) repeat protein